MAHLQHNSAGHLVYNAAGHLVYNCDICPNLDGEVAAALFVTLAGILNPVAGCTNCTSLNDTFQLDYQGGATCQWYYDLDPDLCNGVGWSLVTGIRATLAAAIGGGYDYTIAIEHVGAGAYEYSWTKHFAAKPTPADLLRSTWDGAGGSVSTNCDYATTPATCSVA